MLLAAAQHDLEIREATPNEVKVATAGHGSAAKEQVQRMVQAILGLPEMPAPDDAADALAIAICVANRERSVSRLDAGVLDRSAVAPRPAGVTPYEKAVREALGASGRWADGTERRAYGAAPATGGQTAS